MTQLNQVLDALARILNTARNKGAKPFIPRTPAVRAVEQALNLTGQARLDALLEAERAVDLTDYEDQARI